jgi:hypothetical protein
MKQYYVKRDGEQWVKVDYAQENQPDIGWLYYEREFKVYYKIGCWLYYEIKSMVGFASPKNWLAIPQVTTMRATPTGD